MAEAFGLVVNVLNGAASRYAGWGFNSMAMLPSGQPIAADDNGISMLIGKTDNGVPIGAFFELPTNIWGTSKIKRVREVLIGGESDGDMFLEVSAEETGRRAYPVEGLKAGGEYHEDVVVVARSQTGSVVTLAIGNRNEDGTTDGADFSVDLVEVSVVVLPTVHRRFAIRRGK